LATNFQRCGCASISPSDKAVSAIRAIETIDCDNLLDLFNVITSKMVQAGFAQIDIDMMDEVSGFVCGEEAAEMPTFRQSEGVRFAARGGV